MMAIICTNTCFIDFMIFDLKNLMGTIDCESHHWCNHSHKHYVSTVIYQNAEDRVLCGTKWNRLGVNNVTWTINQMFQLSHKNCANQHSTFAIHSFLCVFFLFVFYFGHGTVLLVLFWFFSIKNFPCDMC